MDLDRFWSLIERSRVGNARDMDAQGGALRQLLLMLQRREVRDFAAIMHAQHALAERYDVWGAGYVLDCGMSDDSFEYFREWLVGQGRDVYEQVLADPDSLADVPGLVVGEYHQTEVLFAAVHRAYEEAFGEELELFDDDEDFDVARRLVPGTPEMGERWQEDDLPRLYPRLTKLTESG
jgi:Protein of unknown function (DUF4240)